MALVMFGKCCSKSWKNPNILFCKLCKTVSRLRSGRHTPADNSRHAFFFLHRFISLNQSVQSQGSSMLVNINDSHLLGDCTIVNVRNLSRRKVFCAPFSLSQRGSVFRTEKVNYLNREDCFRHSGFFGKFNSSSQFFDHFDRDFKLITKS